MKRGTPFFPTVPLFQSYLEISILENYRFTAPFSRFFLSWSLYWTKFSEDLELFFITQFAPKQQQLFIVFKMPCFSKFVVIYSLNTMANGKNTNVRTCLLSDFEYSNEKKMERVPALAKECAKDAGLYYDSEYPMSFHLHDNSCQSQTCEKLVKTFANFEGDAVCTMIYDGKLVSLKEFNKIVHSRIRKKCVADVAFIDDYYPGDAILAAVKALPTTALPSTISDASGMSLVVATVALTSVMLLFL